MPAGCRKRLFDHPALHYLEASPILLRVLTGICIKIHFGELREHRPQPEIPCCDTAILAHHTRLDHRIPQLTNVPWPGVTLEGVQSRAVQLEFRKVLGQEESRQRLDIRAPRSQGRHVQRELAEPVKQITAKTALGHGSL